MAGGLSFWDNCDVWRRRASLQVFLFLCAGIPAFVAQPALSFAGHQGTSRSTSQSTSPVIVIGFVGGFISSDDTAHSPVQLAARLRADYPSAFIKVFENRHRQEAYDEIVHLLDTDHDGSLSAEEKRDARIVIYGISWGGSATVELARDLSNENIPVLLTVQVDSVTKPGQNDSLIPANVFEAANFYQTSGLLHGQPTIKAADPSRTRILGNFRFDYDAHPVACQNYPWYDGILWKQHVEIECDPKVWGQVESLIRTKLVVPGQAEVSRSPAR